MRNGISPHQLPPNSGKVPAPHRLLLKPNEAAAVLGISPRSLWTLTNDGTIPCLRLGRAVRYDPRDLLTWIDQHKGRQISAK